MTMMRKIWCRNPICGPSNSSATFMVPMPGDGYSRLSAIPVTLGFAKTGWRNSQARSTKKYTARKPDPFDPQKLLLQRESSQLLRQALEELPLEFREGLGMREVEGVAYKEIGTIADIPPGTVMSRLARARIRLKQCLSKLIGKED